MQNHQGKDFSPETGERWGHKNEKTSVCWITSVVSHSLRPHETVAARLLSLWDSPGKNTGVGCQVLLQGILPTQGSNVPLLDPVHWQSGSLQLSPPRKSGKISKWALSVQGLNSCQSLDCGWWVLWTVCVCVCMCALVAWTKLLLRSDWVLYYVSEFLCVQ